MTSQKLIKILRSLSDCNITTCEKCEIYDKYCTYDGWKEDYFKVAADTIEKLQADVDRANDECRQLDKNAAEVQREYKAEIERLKADLDRVTAERDKAAEDFYQYVQGGEEICAFCLHDHECEPGETICGATYKGFKWRGLKEQNKQSEVEEG